jgi:hypothetical protein
MGFGLPTPSRQGKVEGGAVEARLCLEHPASRQADK